MSSQKPVSFVTKQECGTHGVGSTEAIFRKKVHIGFSAELVEACTAQQTGSVTKLTTQGTETVTGKSDEQKCRQKVLHKFFIRKGDDQQHSAYAHLTKDNETESTSK